MCVCRYVYTCLYAYSYQMIRLMHVLLLFVLAHTRLDLYSLVFACVRLCSLVVAGTRLCSLVLACSQRLYSPFSTCIRLYSVVRACIHLMYSPVFVRFACPCLYSPLVRACVLNMLIEVVNFSQCI